MQFLHLVFDVGSRCCVNRCKLSTTEVTALFVTTTFTANRENPSHETETFTQTTETKSRPPLTVYCLYFVCIFFSVALVLALLLKIAVQFLLCSASQMLLSIIVSLQAVYIVRNTTTNNY